MTDATGATAPLPPLGLGTYGRTGAAGLAALVAALEIGYRHLDTAQSYDTEANVAAALQASGLKREAVFVTTKVATANLGRDRFRPSLRQSLDQLAMDRVDLLLIHWPSPGDAVPFESYIEDLARAKADKLARHIGVSNFTIAHLARAEALLGPGQIVNNQVEVHPFLQNRRLRAWCAAHGVVVTAYVPLAKGRVAADPVLQAIAAKHGATASEVALAWELARGLVVIPASGNRERLVSNFAAKDMMLDADDLGRIDALDRDERIIAPTGGPAWD